MDNRHGHRTRIAKRDLRPRRVTRGLRPRRVTRGRHLEKPVALGLEQAAHPTVDLPVNHPETRLAQNLRQASVLKALDT